MVHDLSDRFVTFVFLYSIFQFGQNTESQTTNIYHRALISVSSGLENQESSKKQEQTLSDPNLRHYKNHQD